MLTYLLGIAWRSLRRNPVLSLLLVGGIALGIGVSTTFVTAMYILSGHPIPDKEARLFYVEMDSWDPDRPFEDDHQERPPDQMTYIDVKGIMRSDIPLHASGMYKAQLTVHPDSDQLRPYRALVRMCSRDFFPMFEVPFQYGSPWGADADAGPEPVAVIDAETNQKLFGGRNSVGETIRLEDREFRVVGVMAPWKPAPKYYDPHNGPFNDSERIYLPFSWVEPMEIRTAGNTSGWKVSEGSEFKDRLNSESVWIQMWVELDSQEKKAAYLTFLDAYALEQKQLGRFQRPLNNRLLSVRQWLDEKEVVPDEARSMLIIALLFLVVCSVNLIGILLSKFLARSPEVGIRRAFGASRRSIFIQHLLECELVGVVGGVLGLVLALGGLRIIKTLFSLDFPLTLDLNMAMAGIGLSLVSGLLAGTYPAWRICRIPPAAHLKTQ